MTEPPSAPRVNGVAVGLIPLVVQSSDSRWRAVPLHSQTANHTGSLRFDLAVVALIAGYEVSVIVCEIILYRTPASEAEIVTRGQSANPRRFAFMALRLQPGLAVLAAKSE